MCCCCLIVDWLLACPRPIVQSSKPMIGKAMPPFADNTRLNGFLAIQRALRPSPANNTIRAASRRFAAC